MTRATVAIKPGRRYQRMRNKPIKMKETMAASMPPWTAAWPRVGPIVSLEMSVTGGREVSFDLADFYHNESRLIGVDTLKLDLTASAAVLDALAPGFEAWDYRPAEIARRFPLEQAVAAYEAVAAGQRGRVVLQPG